MQKLTGYIAAGALAITMASAAVVPAVAAAASTHHVSPDVGTKKAEF